MFNPLYETQKEKDSYKNIADLEALYKSLPLGACTKDCPCIKFRQTHDLKYNGQPFAGIYGHLYCIQYLFENNIADNTMKRIIFDKVVENDFGDCIKYIIDTKFFRDDELMLSIVMNYLCYYKDSSMLEYLLKDGYKKDKDLIPTAATNKSDKVLKYLLKDATSLTISEFIFATSAGCLGNLKLLYNHAISLGIYQTLKDPRMLCARVAVHHSDCLEYLISIGWDNIQKTDDETCSSLEKIESLYFR